MIKILFCLFFFIGCASPEVIKNPKLEILINSDDLDGKSELKRLQILPGLSEASIEWSVALDTDIDLKIGKYTNNEILNSHKWMLKFGYLGNYTIAESDVSKFTITYNIVFLGEDIDFCRQIFLHEMGHLFGLPHILNENTHDENIFLNGADAIGYIMYPLSNDNNICSFLSDLEIGLAENNWLHK